MIVAIHLAVVGLVRRNFDIARAQAESWPPAARFELVGALEKLLLAPLRARKDASGWGTHMLFNRTTAKHAGYCVESGK